MTSDRRQELLVSKLRASVISGSLSQDNSLFRPSSEYPEYRSLIPCSEPSTTRFSLAMDSREASSKVSTPEAGVDMVTDPTGSSTTKLLEPTPQDDTPSHPDTSSTFIAEVTTQTNDAAQPHANATTSTSLNHEQVPPEQPISTQPLAPTPIAEATGPDTLTIPSGALEPKPASPSPLSAPQLQIPVPQTPQTYITFLFLSGRRRLMNFEPDTTIGRVKELVWGAWSAPSTLTSTATPSADSDATPAALSSPSTGQPNDAEERPPAPSYLRVLYLGRMLQDDDTLRDLKLPSHLPSGAAVSPGGGHAPAPVSTIMHLSIRPSPPPGEEDSSKGKKAGRGRGPGGASDPADEANTGCCGCVIC